MIRHILIGLGSFLITFGILSFLMPAISNVWTLIMLVAGAACVVYAVWVQKS